MKWNGRVLYCEYIILNFILNKCFVYFTHIMIYLKYSMYKSGDLKNMEKWPPSWRHFIRYTICFFFLLLKLMLKERMPGSGVSAAPQPVPKNPKIIYVYSICIIIYVHLSSDNWLSTPKSANNAYREKATRIPTIPYIQTDWHTVLLFTLSWLRINKNKKEEEEEKPIPHPNTIAWNDTHAFPCPQPTGINKKK